MYEPSTPASLHAQLWLARERARRWRQVRDWMLYVAAAVALLSTGVVWPT